MLGSDRHVVRIPRAISHPGACCLIREICKASYIALALLPFACGCHSESGATVAHSTHLFPQKTGFIERHVTVDGSARTVWVFLPPDYNPNRLYPAILFLHGLFEEGNGGTNVLSAGLGPVIARNPSAWPFITIFPQSSGTWQGEDREKLAMAALKDAQKNYPIDPDRIILAGLSYGGLGVWEIGTKDRSHFAALVPVSGFATTQPSDRLASIPVWAFASKQDPFVTCDNSEKMCQFIDAHGGHAHLTEFDSDQHDCWLMAVDKSDVVNWMLNQARNPLRVDASTSGGSRYQSGKLRSWSDH